MATIKYIVIHHTATRDDLTAEAMLLSMTRHRIDNKGFGIVPAHFIVDKWGHWVQANGIGVNVGAVAKDKYNTYSQVSEANNNGIHIELIGDFNVHEPTKKQYDAVMAIYNKIGKDLVLKYHSDFQAKNCPGAMFNKEEMSKMFYHL